MVHVQCAAPALDTVIMRINVRGKKRTTHTRMLSVGTFAPVESITLLSGLYIYAILLGEIYFVNALSEIV